LLPTLEAFTARPFKTVTPSLAKTFSSTFGKRKRKRRGRRRRKKKTVKVMVTGQTQVKSGIGYSSTFFFRVMVHAKCKIMGRYKRAT
jgi:hypothetical protein